MTLNEATEDKANDVLVSGQINWKVKKIPAEIGCMSLVGVFGEEYPIRFGNYFTFRSGHYCLNMWAENLREWLKINPVEEIEILEIEDERLFCLVIDKAIPKDWLNSTVCWTGCVTISEGLRHMITKSITE